MNSADNSNNEPVNGSDQNQEKKEYPPYELVAYPNEEKGTTWTKHGVAWFAKDGKRLRIKLFMDKPLPEDGKLLLVESLRTAFKKRDDDTPF